MALQYISDNAGKHTAVIIPIAEWESITAKHEDLMELMGEKVPQANNAARFKGLLTDEEAGKTDEKLSKKKPSDFAGLLTKEEGEKFHKYLKKARNEWERNFQ